MSMVSLSSLLVTSLFLFLLLNNYFQLLLPFTLRGIEVYTPVDAGELNWQTLTLFTNFIHNHAADNPNPIPQFALEKMIPSYFLQKLKQLVVLRK